MSLITPTNIHCSSRTSSSVTVAWDAVPGATGYKIQTYTPNFSGAEESKIPMMTSDTTPEGRCTASEYYIPPAPYRGDYRPFKAFATTWGGAEWRVDGSHYGPLWIQYQFEGRSIRANRLRIWRTGPSDSYITSFFLYGSDDGVNYNLMCGFNNINWYDGGAGTCEISKDFNINPVGIPVGHDVSPYLTYNYFRLIVTGSKRYPINYTDKKGQMVSFNYDPGHWVNCAGIQLLGPADAGGTWNDYRTISGTSTEITGLKPDTFAFRLNGKVTPARIIALGIGEQSSPSNGFNFRTLFATPIITEKPGILFHDFKESTHTLKTVISYNAANKPVFQNWDTTLFPMPVERGGRGPQTIGVADNTLKLRVYRDNSGFGNNYVKLYDINWDPVCTSNDGNRTYICDNALTITDNDVRNGCNKYKLYMTYKGEEVSNPLEYKLIWNTTNKASVPQVTQLYLDNYPGIIYLLNGDSNDFGFLHKTTSNTYTEINGYVQQPITRGGLYGDTSSPYSNNLLSVTDAFKNAHTIIKKIPPDYGLDSSVIGYIHYFDFNKYNALSGDYSTYLGFNNGGYGPSYDGQHYDVLCKAQFKCFPGITGPEGATSLIYLNGSNIQMDQNYNVYVNLAGFPSDPSQIIEGYTAPKPPQEGWATPCKGGFTISWDDKSETKLAHTVTRVWESTLGVGDPLVYQKTYTVPSTRSSITDTGFSCNGTFRYKIQSISAKSGRSSTPYYIYNITYDKFKTHSCFLYTENTQVESDVKPATPVITSIKTSINRSIKIFWPIDNRANTHEIWWAGDTVPENPDYPVNQYGGWVPLDLTHKSNYYEINNLSYETLYSFKVISYKDTIPQYKSDAGRLDNIKVKIPAPTNFQADLTPGGTVILTWDDNHLVDNIRLNIPPTASSDKICNGITLYTGNTYGYFDIYREKFPEHIVFDLLSSEEGNPIDISINNFSGNKNGNIIIYDITRDFENNIIETWWEFDGNSYLDFNNILGYEYTQDFAILVSFTPKEIKEQILISKIDETTGIGYSIGMNSDGTIYIKTNGGTNAVRKLTIPEICDTEHDYSVLFKNDGSVHDITGISAIFDNGIWTEYTSSTPGVITTINSVNGSIQNSSSLKIGTTFSGFIRGVKILDDFSNIQIYDYDSLLGVSIESECIMTNLHDYILYDNLYTNYGKYRYRIYVIPDGDNAYAGFDYLSTTTFILDAPQINIDSETIYWNRIKHASHYHITVLVNNNVLVNEYNTTETLLDIPRFLTGVNNYNFWSNDNVGNKLTFEITALNTGYISSTPAISSIWTPPPTPTNFNYVKTTSNINHTVTLTWNSNYPCTLTRTNSSTEESITLLDYSTEHGFVDSAGSIGDTYVYTLTPQCEGYDMEDKLSGIPVSTEEVYYGIHTMNLASRLFTYNNQIRLTNSLRLYCDCPVPTFSFLYMPVFTKVNDGLAESLTLFVQPGSLPCVSDPALDLSVITDDFIYKRAFLYIDARMRYSENTLKLFTLHDIWAANSIELYTTGGGVTELWSHAGKIAYLYTNNIGCVDHVDLNIWSWNTINKSTALTTYFKAYIMNILPLYTVGRLNINRTTTLTTVGKNSASSFDNAPPLFVDGLGVINDRLYMYTANNSFHMNATLPFYTAGSHYGNVEMSDGFDMFIPNDQDHVDVSKILYLTTNIDVPYVFRNVLTDGFEGEDWFGNWGFWGTGSYTQENTIVHLGGSALKFTNIGGGAVPILENIPVVPGTYRLSFWLKNADGVDFGGGSNNVELNPPENTVGYDLFTNIMSTPLIENNTEYTYYSRDFLIPDGATSATFYFYLNENGYVYLDDIRLEHIVPGTLAETAQPLYIQGGDLVEYSRYIYLYINRPNESVDCSTSIFINVMEGELNSFVEMTIAGIDTLENSVTLCVPVVIYGDLNAYTFLHTRCEYTLNGDITLCMPETYDIVYNNMTMICENNSEILNKYAEMYIFGAYFKDNSLELCIPNTYGINTTSSPLFTAGY